MAEFKKGETRLWNADLTVMVKFSRGEYVPTDDELVKISGLQRI